MMYEATSFECSRIAQDLQIRKLQVESVVQLFNEGNTIPFITRYRKERTGGLEEEVIRQIQARLNFLKQLNDRKHTILKSIETHGKLTEELGREILHAPTVRRLEDLYLPFKAKKKSLALPARDKGLDPLALAIWHSDPAVGNLDELLPALVNPEKQLNTVEDVKAGVQHILAELINETAAVRAEVRRVLWKAGVLTAVRNEKAPEGLGNEFKPYFQFKESTQDIRPHRILALNRGEKEGFLKIKLEWPAEPVMQTALAVLADHLLKVAGQPAQPASPAPPPAPPKPEPPPEPMPPAPGEPPSPDGTPPSPPAPGEPPPLATPPAPSPPETPPEMPPMSPPDMPGAPPDLPSLPPPMEMPPMETPTPPSAPVELPPMSPPFGAPPGPHAAAPLVESLSTEPKPVLTGDPLVEGIDFRSPHSAFLKACVEDALNRLMLPTLEREIRTELTDEAELHAIKVFAHNIRSLLMQPPMIGRRVLAIDPGFRTGCKLAALDEHGNLLAHTVIYPHGGGPGGGRKGRDKDKKPKDQPAAVVPTPAEQPAQPPVADAPGSPVQQPPVAGASGSPVETPPVADAPGSPDAAPETPTLTPEMAASTTATPEVGHVEPAPAPVADAPGSPGDSPVADASASPVEQPPVTDAPGSPVEPPPVDKRAEAKAKLVEFVKQHNLNVIALGNGTACRDTEEIVADVIATCLPELEYVIISEAGASVYSVSPVAKEELPNLEASIRSGVSIGRRLQDPLSELVKIDPQSLGVGLYQHDMGRKELKESLEGVVESCVNQVGADVNTASVPLLRCVSGLNQLVAREIVEHRKAHGPFTSREQLQSITGMTPTRFTQAAGFLKVSNAPNPLDRVWIHPESYGVAERVLAELGFAPSALEDKAAHAEFRNKLNEVDLEALARKLDVGVPTLDHIFFALARPGKDPRDDMPPPIFKKGILKLEDLQPGQELKGTVLNVVDFGAFVDVGLKDSGLVHISQMANKYIKSPYDVTSVNDIVTVWVLKIDKDSNHVSLTMIRPGSERQVHERGQRPPRREGEGEGEGQPQDRGQRPPPRGRGGPPRDQQREGQGQRQGSRPPRGRSGPPRQGAPSRDQQREASPPPPPPPPPRKPRREAPKPKLTQAAMEGKAPLRTLGELAAFFAAKEEKDKPAPPPPMEAHQEPPPPAPEPPPSEPPAS